MSFSSRREELSAAETDAAFAGARSGSHDRAVPYPAAHHTGLKRSRGRWCGVRWLAITILFPAFVTSGCASMKGFQGKLFGSGASAASSPRAAATESQVAADGTEKEAAEKPLSTASESGAPAPEAPIDLTVAQAFYDGPKLRLKVRLNAKSSVRTDEIVVSVAALRDGQTVEVHDQRLADIVPFSRLDAGESAVVPFTLNSESLSEYQVALRWGDDAKDSAHAPFRVAGQKASGTAMRVNEARSAGGLNNSPQEGRASLGGGTMSADPDEYSPDPKGTSTGGEPLVLKVMALDRKEERCDEPPCEIRYTVHAMIRNNGRSPLNGVRLASGFVWVEEGAVADPPASFEPARTSEAIVDLYQLTVAPGAERKLKIKVDRAVPAIPGGEFRPYLRIVDTL